MMRGVPGWACGLLFLAPAAQAADVLVARIEEAVVIEHANDSSGSLVVREPLGEGDALASSNTGRASLRFTGGSIVVGGNAALQFESGEIPDIPGRGALVRFRLDAGAVHVDARKQDQIGAADVRLSMRFLKARLLGTDAWAEASIAGDELCVISGAAEIDTPAAHVRLDSPGECLRWTRGGAQRLSAAEAGDLRPRLAAVSFSDDYASRYGGEQARRAGRARPTLAEARQGIAAATLPVAPKPPAPALGTIDVIEAPAPVVAARAAEAALPAAQPVPGEAVWRIALGAFIDRANAEHARALWRRRGLQTDIDTVTRAGRNSYRVLTGRYPSRAVAETALSARRKSAGFEKAQVVETGAASTAAPPAVVAADTTDTTESLASAAGPAPESSAAPASAPASTPAAAPDAVDVSEAPPAASRSVVPLSAEPAAPARPAAAPQWRIALGTFIDAANAERSRALWRQRGVQTEIEATVLSGRSAYRVLTGHYSSRGAADQALAARRKSTGFEKARVIDAAAVSVTAPPAAGPVLAPRLPAAAAPAPVAATPPSPPPEPTPETAVARSQWRIELGVFIDAANAQRSQTQWRQRTLQTEVARVERDGRAAYQLLTGHYASRSAAEQALAALRKNAGFEKAQVVALPAPPAGP